MTEAVSGLSDEALAVFAFAAYHQLSSGQIVRSIVQRDGAGHQASDAAVSELQGRGLIEADGRDTAFTPPGAADPQATVSAPRGRPAAPPWPGSGAGGWSGPTAGTSPARRRGKRPCRR